MTENTMTLDVDVLANEIRRADGWDRLGAGELAEKLMPWITAHLSRSVSVSDEDVARVRDAVSHALSDALDCTRVWEAWSYGTMSEHDFIEVRDQPDRVDEIARAALEADRAGRGMDIPAIADTTDVPAWDELASRPETAWVQGWNACREAMLAKTQPGAEGNGNG